MANVQGPTPQKYHRNRRKELLATAEVQLLQAQVIGKDGREFTAVFWICGPDIFYANELSDLFTSKRFKAPEWVREQLKTLPPSRRFDCWGNAKNGDDQLAHPTKAQAQAPAPATTVSTPGPAPKVSDSLSDDDLPEFKEA